MISPIASGFTPKELSLEEKFRPLITKISFCVKSAFNFLISNELDPLRAYHLFEMKEKGLIVSTGTERSFFDLILATCQNQENCQGLVIVDLNPEVKGYVDFLIALLKIADTREEYEALSSDISTVEDFPSRIRQIRLKLFEKGSSDPLFFYYIKNLEKFASLYFQIKKVWRTHPEITPHFQKVDYHACDESFAIVQRHAQQGNIIAKTGDIKDLSFLEEEHIEIIDISNIGDYTTIDFENRNFALSPPKIIWTDLFLGQPLLIKISPEQNLLYYKTHFRSHEFPVREYTEQDRKELRALLDFFREKDFFSYKTNSIRRFFRKMETSLSGRKKIISKYDSGPIFESKELLQQLRQFKDSLETKPPLPME